MSCCQLVLHFSMTSARQVHHQIKFTFASACPFCALPLLSGVPSSLPSVPSFATIKRTCTQACISWYIINLHHYVMPVLQPIVILSCKSTYGMKEFSGC